MINTAFLTQSPLFRNLDETERAQYSVSTDDKATLLYRRDNETAVAVPVFVRLAANYNHWYLDRCELSWTPMP